MALPPLIGHRELRARLAAAVRGGKLPQVLLLTGGLGVGKQRLALWLAQSILCQTAGDEPCGSCRACKLASNLSHPDLHWFVPVPRSKASDPDKQVEEVGQALAQVMEERRARPLYGEVDGMASHGIATVRLLQRRAALTSVEGGPRIFIIGDADRLVAQEASPEAANALLKLLEEPPDRSFFLLTTVEPRRLLPTIRSRTVTLRLGRLTDDEVREFLADQLQPRPAGQELEDRVAFAEGSIGRALGAREEAGRARQAATQLLESVLASPAAAYERALRQAPWSARGEFTAMLDALAELLGDAARSASGQEPRREMPPALARLRSPAALVQALEKVADAREAAWGNVNPQLLVADLSNQLAEVL
jgi:DNA polymerase-3 subunit delta'